MKHRLSLARQNIRLTRRKSVTGRWNVPWHKSGKSQKKIVYGLDEEQNQEEALYDGFYVVVTNLEEHPKHISWPVISACWYNIY